jgi:hypothetical protein
MSSPEAMDRIYSLVSRVHHTDPQHLTTPKLNACLRDAIRQNKEMQRTRSVV